MEVQRDTGILAGRTMTQPQQHYDVTDDDFDFIWKNIDSPLVVRDRINVIKTRSNSYQSGRDKVLELLEDLRKYANREYKEADLSDNEHDLRIHLEYENRIWGIMKELRPAGG